MTGVWFRQDTLSISQEFSAIEKTFRAGGENRSCTWLALPIQPKESADVMGNVNENCDVAMEIKLINILATQILTFP